MSQKQQDTKLLPITSPDVANLPLSLTVKEFRKSVNIWGSYGQEFSVLFFLTHGVLCYGQGDTSKIDFSPGRSIRSAASSPIKSASRMLPGKSWGSIFLFTITLVKTLALNKRTICLNTV